MGWNTSVLLIEKSEAEALLAWLPDVFSYPKIDEDLGFEQAASGHPGGRLYLAEIEDWAALWDPDLRFAPRIEALIRSSGAAFLEGRAALSASFNSVHSRYGFDLWRDGQRARRAVFVSGEAEESAGEPLPIEASIPRPSWGHDEDFLFAIIEAITDLSQGRFEAARFAAHAVEA